MIGSLRGEVVHRQENVIIIDVQGVGYEVTISDRVLGRSAVGAKLSLVVHTDVRENDISLFGFDSHLEREVFLLLKRVKGIGSRTAMSVVATLGAEGVLTAVGQEDITELKRVPGVGTKTAERMIVELREQVGALATSGEPKRTGVPGSRLSRPGESRSSVPSQGEDVVLALEKLGFPADRARQVVTRALEASPQQLLEDSGELLRRALGSLAEPVAHR